MATSSELEQRLLDGRLDAVLTASAPANDGLKATLVLKHPLHVVASVQHPAAKLKSCTIAQLADYSLLGRDITTATSQPLARLFASAGRTFAPAMTFATTEAVKHAVLAGLGVALLPEMAIAPELRDGSLKVVRVKGVRLHQHVWWLERDGHGRSKAAQAYWCIVEHAAHNKLPKPRSVAT